MYIELKCKECGNYFQIDFEENEISENKCPKCGYYFSNQHFSHLAEVYYSAQRHSTDIKLVGLSSGKRNIVFDLDIENLNNIFNTSDKDVQIQITRLLDIMYLLIRREAKDGNIDELNKIIADVRRLYNRRNGHPEDFLIKEDYSSGPLLGEFES